jgi:hypothetical protein
VIPTRVGIWFVLINLATCCCNDIYREAAKGGIKVEVEGDFDAEGELAKNISYRAKVEGQGNKEDRLELLPVFFL